MSVQPSLANQMLMSLHHQQQMISQLQKQMNLFMQASTPPHGVNPVQFVNNGGQQQQQQQQSQTPTTHSTQAQVQMLKNPSMMMMPGPFMGSTGLNSFGQYTGAASSSVGSSANGGNSQQKLGAQKKGAGIPTTVNTMATNISNNTTTGSNGINSTNSTSTHKKKRKDTPSHPPGMSSTTSTVHQTASHSSMPTQMLTSGNSNAAVYKHTPSYHAPSSNSLPMAMLNDQDPLQQFMVDDYVNALANSGANALIGDGGYGPMMSFNPTDALERLLFD